MPQVYRKAVEKEIHMMLREGIHAIASGLLQSRRMTSSVDCRSQDRVGCLTDVEN